MKYEPLIKNRLDPTASPKGVIVSKDKLRNKLLSQRTGEKIQGEALNQNEIIDVETANTFYENQDKSAASFYNHRSFLLKDNQFIVDPNVNTAKKKYKKSKPQTLTKKKTHTKGNNSVYMKDFEKLMKERSNVDNKSVKRMKILKTYEQSESSSKPKICSIPVPSKLVKKSKKNLNAISNKQIYHKRVKSDQIYSVKLLIRNEEKAKAANKEKLIHISKQPSMTRPSTKKNKSILSGYSKLINDPMINGQNETNMIRSHN